MQKCWSGKLKDKDNSVEHGVDVDNNSIKFTYLCAWQQPDKANYSQALKQQYRIKNILKSTNDLKIKN
jgi:hypothetical protein